MERSEKTGLCHLTRGVLLALYCAALVLLLTRHENWRDEAQAWLLARDLDFAGLVRQMSYEGHPCLWHLLLMPLVRLGLPYVSMNALSIALTVAAAALMLWKSPLPLPVQLAVLLSAPFLYLFPILSRSYALIPPILFMIAVIYPDRRQRPLAYGLWIALLVQTQIMMLGMAGALSLFWLGESLAAYRRDRSGKTLGRQAAGLTLPLASLGFLLVQLSGASDSSAFPKSSALRPSALLRSLRKVLRLSFQFVDRRFAMLLLLLFAVGVAVFFLWALRRAEAWKPVLIFLMGLGAMLLLMVVTRRYADQKRAVLVPMLVWMLWTSWPRAKERLPRIAMLLMAGAVCLPMFWQNRLSTWLDWNWLVSDARPCAEYLEENVPDDAIIVEANDARGAALLPYMSRETLLSAKTGRQISYATWKKNEFVIQDVEQLRAWMRENRPGDKSVWLVCQAGSALLEPQPGVEMVYETQARIKRTDELYRVYRVDVQ